MNEKFFGKKRPGGRAAPFQPGRLERTARRGRLWDFCAVFLFLLLLPYACSLLFGEKTARQTVGLPQEKEEEGCMVVLEEEAGEIRLPMETYLEGALAASIPADSGTETLKAQAIILRTLCRKAWEETGRTEQVRAEEIGQSYLDEEGRRRLWKDGYEEKQRAVAAAVADTAGMVLARDGAILEPAYFRLSAGRTRDGGEVLGEDYAYMVSVDCSHDVEDAAYRASIRLEEEEFWRALDGKAEERIALVRDSADYVLSVEYGEETMSGEAFRLLFGLPSSCFTIQEEEGQIILTSLGIGHGLGFCQSEAERREREGEDYLALLQLFFEGAQIQKIS